MIFFFKSDGTLIKSAPETVYQGSAEAGKVYVVAPLNANMLVDVYYELPNGERWGAYLLENNGTVINNEELPDGWALWSTTLESAITQYAGTLKAQFGFYQSGTADKVPLITSQGVTITIAKGIVRDVFPDSPSPQVYEYITNAVTTILQNFDNLQNEYLSNTNEDKIALKNNNAIEYSENATAGTIAKRDSDGKINVADGTEDSNAVNLGQFNAALANKVDSSSVSATAVKDTIPQRTATGQLKAADGVADDDLATVKQLNAVQGKYTDITNIDLNTGDTTVEYDTELGITVNAKGTVTHENGATEQPTTKFELPIIAGEGVSIDKKATEEKVEIKSLNSNLENSTGESSLRQKYIKNNTDYSAQATGENAAAFGGKRWDELTNSSKTPTSAEGKQSFAAGGSVHAIGDFSAAFGKDTVARQRASFAAGSSTAGMTEDEFNKFFWDSTNNVGLHGGSKNADGQICDFTGAPYERSYAFATALGCDCQAKGPRSFAAGDNAKASNTGATATGARTTASGTDSFATGADTIAAGDMSFTANKGTKATGVNSSAFGYETVAHAPNSFVVGKDNKLSDDALFIVGNGVDWNNRSTAFEVLKDGRAKVQSAPTEADDVVRKKELDSALTSVYTYKGSKDTYANLPATGNNVGDVWNVEDTGTNYAWNGANWGSLSANVLDSTGNSTVQAMSQKSTTDELNKKVNTTDNFVKAFTIPNGASSGTLTADVKQKLCNPDGHNYYVYDDTSQMILKYSFNADDEIIQYKAAYLQNDKAYEITMQILPSNGSWRRSQTVLNSATANPTLTGTEEELTGLKVGGTDYKIPANEGLNTLTYVNLTFSNTAVQYDTTNGIQLNSTARFTGGAGNHDASMGLALPVVGKDGIVIEKAADSEKIEVSGKNFVTVNTGAADGYQVYRWSSYTQSLGYYNVAYRDDWINADRLPLYFNVNGDNGKRSTTATLVVGTPKQPYHAANKKYVDDAIASILSPTQTKYQHNLILEGAKDGFTFKAFLSVMRSDDTVFSTFYEVLNAIGGSSIPCTGYVYDSTKYHSIFALDIDLAGLVYLNLEIGEQILFVTNDDVAVLDVII